MKFLPCILYTVCCILCLVPCILYSVCCILLLTSPSEKQLLDQKLAITDQQIDALAYEMYGLTENEARIVEGG